VLIAFGAEESEAAVVADALVWRDLMDRPTQGVWLLPITTKRLALGLIKSPGHPHFVKTAPAVEILDGDQGFGYAVGSLAMRKALDLARGSGVGLVGVKNSNHFGAGAYYVHLAAEANMIGFAMSNSLPLDSSVPLMVSPSNHKRISLRQAQAERMTIQLLFHYFRKTQ
jgi:LDH2 family malate/lactate/ureidoglycolate dehydrogenase